MNMVIFQVSVTKRRIKLTTEKAKETQRGPVYAQDSSICSDSEESGSDESLLPAVASSKKSG